MHVYAVQRITTCAFQFVAWLQPNPKSKVPATTGDFYQLLVKVYFQVEGPIAFSKETQVPAGYNSQPATY